jgi:N6-L-threonylcarbamoyladenine synthase
VILALETSCDDSCAAVVSPGGEIHSNVISSQGVHDRYGGVVPEVASRHHLELLNVVVDDALRQADAGLDDVELVAVTRGPGLVGALLVGVQTAKGLAAARRLPLAAVDHLHGHVAANFLAGGWDRSQTPFLCLIASGGHTLLCRVDDEAHYEVLGRTLDDAAGEAFDKGARMLGLGYPPRADLAASYQDAIVRALVQRCARALERTGLTRLALGGGVAANGLLRERARALADEVHVPPIELCTDNAAMIASAARFVPALPYPEYLGLDAYATGEAGHSPAVHGRPPAARSHHRL